MTIPKTVIATAAVLGAAFGGYGIASAANSSSAATTATAATTASQPARPTFSGPAHGTAAHEHAEKPVTGSAASKAQTAAVAAAGGGTAGAVTTDFTGNGYEVTVTKADGNSVEYHLDSSFTVFAGGPGGR